MSIKQELATRKWRIADVKGFNEEDIEYYIGTIPATKVIRNGITLEHIAKVCYSKEDADATIKAHNLAIELESDKNNTRIILRLPLKTKKLLQGMANKNDTSLSNQIRNIIDLYFKDITDGTN